MVHRLAFIAALGLTVMACTEAPAPIESDVAQPNAPHSALLLITLDTTRGDAVGPGAQVAVTPNLTALAARGLWFEQAYTTAPTTLPAHASMLTGLYPSEHGVHENARRLSDQHELLASRLKAAGYATAAVVSGLPLDGRFGLARGFDQYQDDLPDGQSERRADQTTDRALELLTRQRQGSARQAPLFLWVHYFDAHDPYDPPEPFRSQHSDPYLGEIAFMDQQIGRLLDAFEERHRGEEFTVLVVADHGEGRGDHGEALHGNLLYQGVMRVPLLIAGSGIAPSVRSEVVSTRRVFDTLLDRGGIGGGIGDDPAEAPRSLLNTIEEPAVAEAMKPFLQYGWQPQVMAVQGDHKWIRAGELEAYDVRRDGAETEDLSAGLPANRALLQILRDYPLPAQPGIEPELLSPQEKERLASLGYADWQSRSPLRDDAPAPRHMTGIFADLDLSSALFVAEEYDAAITVFERILLQDPNNFGVVLRLAIAHSMRGRVGAAEQYLRRADALSPGHPDALHYRAMHLLRHGRAAEALPLFEQVVARMPDRQTAWLELARLRMASGDTENAIAAFEQVWALAGDSFDSFLELGVCYMAARRFEEARDSLDQVALSHPAYPMALFKRAQVSVLLNEPDHRQRIQQAMDEADSTTAPLIRQESLFAIPENGRVEAPEPTRH